MSKFSSCDGLVSLCSLSDEPVDEELNNVNFIFIVIILTTIVDRIVKSWNDDLTKRFRRRRSNPHIK